MQRDWLKCSALFVAGLLCSSVASKLYLAAREISQAPTNHEPKKVAIPDEATAIEVGMAILRPVYGGKLWSERPFKASLTNSVWWVRGSLPNSIYGRAKGGVAEVFLSQSNGSVLNIYHSK